MKPENPYAAPQTITGRVAPSELPLAEAVGRNLFPETSTRELERLAGWSISIETMSLLWGLLFSLTVLAFCSQLGTNPFPWGWSAAMLLSGLRMWGGTARAPIYWAYDLLLDAVFALAVVWAAFHLAKSDVIGLFLVGGVALLFMGLACVSVVAHFVARPLYGRFSQCDLVTEVGYRRRNRIE